MIFRFVMGVAALIAAFALTTYVAQLRFFVLFATPKVAAIFDALHGEVFFQKLPEPTTTSTTLPKQEV